MLPLSVLNYFVNSFGLSHKKHIYFLLFSINNGLRVHGMAALLLLEALTVLLTFFTNMPREHADEADVLILNLLINSLPKINIQLTVEIQLVSLITLFSSSLVS